MKKFKCKFDFWYYLLAAFLICFSGYALFGKTKFNITPTVFSVGILFLLCLFFFILPPIFYTNYTINGINLIIHAGFFKKTILLKNISKVCDQKSSMSSTYAFSCDRIRIYYSPNGGAQETMIDISPKEKVKFQEAISPYIHK